MHEGRYVLACLLFLVSDLLSCQKRPTVMRVNQTPKIPLPIIAYISTCLGLNSQYQEHSLAQAQAKYLSPTFLSVSLEHT